MKNLIPDFDMEGSSCCQIKYQSYGRPELYSNGQLGESTYSRPRYFSTGKCLTNIANQNRLVDNVFGESTNLPEDTAERRQCNYIHFTKQERNDGGYSRLDVPRVAHGWGNIWGRILK